MDDSKQTPSRQTNRGWLILLLSAAVGVVAVAFPAGLCLVAAVWAYAGARTKPYWITLPAVVFIISASMVYTPIAAAGISGAVVISAVLLYVLLTKRFSNTYVALSLAGVFLVGLYTAVCLPGILDGSGAFTSVQNAITPMVDFYKSVISEVNGANEASIAVVIEVLDAYVKDIPNLVVAALCIFSGVLGLSNLLFFRLFVKKHPEISISPMRPFRDWTLPRSMTFGLFVLLIGSIALELYGWEYSDSLSSTVNVLVGMPLLLQGLCVVDFLIVRSPKNVTLGRTLAFTAIAVLYGLLQTPLILIGCFDQIFRFRERLRGVPPRTAV